MTFELIWGAFGGGFWSQNDGKKRVEKYTKKKRQNLDFPDETRGYVHKKSGRGGDAGDDYIEILS